jgi:hypothetical protein
MDGRTGLFVALSFDRLATRFMVSLKKSSARALRSSMWCNNWTNIRENRVEHQPLETRRWAQVRHQCPWFIGDFLSRGISTLYSVDNTIGELKAETKDTICEFSPPISLGRGKAITTDSSHRNFHDPLSKESVNEELCVDDAVKRVSR